MKNLLPGANIKRAGKNRDKFRVVQAGGNHEVLNVSEVLESRAAVRKNVLANAAQTIRAFESELRILNLPGLDLVALRRRVREALVISIHDVPEPKKKGAR